MFEPVCAAGPGSSCLVLLQVASPQPLTLLPLLLPAVYHGWFWLHNFLDWLQVEFSDQKALVGGGLWVLKIIKTILMDKETRRNEILNFVNLPRPSHYKFRIHCGLCCCRLNLSPSSIQSIFIVNWRMDVEFSLDLFLMMLKLWCLRRRLTAASPADLSSVAVPAQCQCWLHLQPGGGLPQPDPQQEGEAEQQDQEGAVRHHDWGERGDQRDNILTLEAGGGCGGGARGVV